VIDHIAYVASDIEKAKDTLVKHLGIEPVGGGGHWNLGTHNYLMSLGGRQYLEIAGPNRNNPVDSPLSRYLDMQITPDVMMFAVETDDAPKLAKSFTKRGIKVSEWSESRTAPDGTVLNYRGFSVVDHPFKGLVPFYIEWVDCDHPGVTSPQGASMEIAICHPEPAELQTFYDRIDFELKVTFSNKPGILVKISSKSGVVILQGVGHGMSMV
jgi:catechol 2,3-dioxygenase-like lactoylglutathione lyase family enzyme